MSRTQRRATKRDRQCLSPSSRLKPDQRPLTEETMARTQQQKTEDGGAMATEIRVELRRQKKLARRHAALERDKAPPLPRPLQVSSHHMTTRGVRIDWKEADAKCREPVWTPEELRIGRALGGREQALRQSTQPRREKVRDWMGRPVSVSDILGLWDDRELISHYSLSFQDREMMKISSKSKRVLQRRTIWAMVRCWC